MRPLQSGQPNVASHWPAAVQWHTDSATQPADAYANEGKLTAAVKAAMVQTAKEITNAELSEFVFKVTIVKGCDVLDEQVTSLSVAIWRKRLQTTGLAEDNEVFRELMRDFEKWLSAIDVEKSYERFKKGQLKSSSDASLLDRLWNSLFGEDDDDGDK